MSSADSKQAESARAVASQAGTPAAAASSAATLTHAQKKCLLDDPTSAIPLFNLGAEFRLLAQPCAAPESGAKNCKHNVACLHGLGVQKKGVWDPKGSAVSSLLGLDPHLRARQPDSHVGLRNMGATYALHARAHAHENCAGWIFVLTSLLLRSCLAALLLSLSLSPVATSTRCSSVCT
jgi:hypothetical protein